MSKEALIAIESAKEAGALIKKGFLLGSHNVSRKEDNSPVTEMDYQSSELITQKIRTQFPTHKILSEESPNALAQEIGNEPTWVIDPLDGTSNFIAGIPLFGVAIALVINRQPVTAVIYDPLHDDLLAAQVGKGTMLNGQQIFVSNKKQTKGAMLFAGRGYRDRDKERHGHIIYALEQETTYFRRLGTATIMLASVAAGRADSVILTGNKPWDVAAGALLIREAGGRVTDYCGKEWSLDSEDMVATNGGIHDQIITITREQDDVC